jgi:hypothetical protein
VPVSESHKLFQRQFDTKQILRRMKTRLTVFSRDTGTSLLFTLDALGNRFFIIQKEFLTINDVEKAYQQGYVAFDTEIIEEYYLSHSKSATVDLFKNKCRTLLIDLNDDGSTLPLRRPLLDCLIDLSSFWIKREPDLVKLKHRGVSVEKLIPTVCSFIPINHFDSSGVDISFKPLFYGVTSSSQRIGLAAYLVRHLGNDFQLTLLKPQREIFKGQNRCIYKHPELAPFVRDLNQSNYLPPDEYASQFMRNGTMVCFPGLGHFTERHLQGFASGRVVLSSASINRLTIPMLELKNGDNCIIYNSSSDLLMAINASMADRAHAISIAKRGQEMFRDCFSPSRWMRQYLDVLV